MDDKLDCPTDSRTVNEFRMGASLIRTYYRYTNDGYPNADTLGIQGLVPVASAMVPPLPRSPSAARTRLPN